MMVARDNPYSVGNPLRRLPPPGDYEAPPDHRGAPIQNIYLTLPPPSGRPRTPHFLPPEDYDYAPVDFLSLLRGAYRR